MIDLSCKNTSSGACEDSIDGQEKTDWICTDIPISNCFMEYDLVESYITQVSYKQPSADLNCAIELLKLIFDVRPILLISVFFPQKITQIYFICFKKIYFLKLFWQLNDLF